MIRFFFHLFILVLSVGCCRHGNEVGTDFSVRGIKLAVEFFVARGHAKIKAFVPRFRRDEAIDDALATNTLDELERCGYLAYTPSRYIDKRLAVSNDRRFILKAAYHYNAVIVSNDAYDDLMHDNYDWKNLIENKYIFVFTYSLFYECSSSSTN